MAILAQVMPCGQILVLYPGMSPQLAPPAATLTWLLIYLLVFVLVRDTPSCLAAVGCVAATKSSGHPVPLQLPSGNTVSINGPHN